MIYLDKRDRFHIAGICAVVFVAIIAFNQDIRQTVGHAILYGVAAPLRGPGRLRRVHRAALRR
jgi:hypothetical protein